MAPELDMKVNYPGLLRERLPSGQYRYRVRVEGDPGKRVRLHVTPDDAAFKEHYQAARGGIEIQPEAPPEERAARGSVAWLIDIHTADLEAKVKAGQMAEGTLKKRRIMFNYLRAHCGEYDLNMPTSAVVELRDKLMSRPAMADNTVKAIRSMYRWAGEMGLCSVNPAAGVANIDRGKGGATPWTVEDLKVYMAHHPAGTTAHLCLCLLLFTGCRIGDAVWLGRKHEFTRDGVTGLGWQPGKRGSRAVSIPMTPQLYRATRAVKVLGSAYILRDDGQPFSSADALGQRFVKWCKQAGLEGRSAHGVRKALGHLLAHEGSTQHEIMAIHGHTQAKTSEVYTSEVDRWRLSVAAMRKIKRIDWT